MNIGDTINATFITGGGTTHDEGVFVVDKITKVFMYLKMIEEGYFAQYPDWKIRKIPLKDYKSRKEPMPKWIEDSYFVCYHHQSGTPTIYEKITP